jgi:hypothetical protein
MAIGEMGAYILVGLVPVETPNDWWFLILSGAVAICLMIGSQRKIWPLDDLKSLNPPIAQSQFNQITEKVHTFVVQFQFIRHPASVEGIVGSVAL